MRAKTYIFVTILFVLFSQMVPASIAIAKAKAGPDQTVDEGDTVILDGSASKLPHGINLYQWEQTGGSPTINLVNADKAQASFTAPDVGGAGTLLTFKLTVSNNSGDLDTDTTKVTVRPANHPPKASFTASPTSGETPLKVNFDASGSSDPDGSISSYSWDFGDGDTSSGVKISHTYTKAGTYTVKLTVTDDDGVTDTATRTIMVSAANQPPKVNPDSYSTDEDIALTITAPGVLGNDTDPEVQPLTAVLQTGPTDGSLNLNSDGSFSYTPNDDFSGTDSFSYFANDGTENSTLAATVTITVNPVPDPPVATDDSYAIDEDTTLDITAPGVLANDKDPDGEPLTATRESGPSDGTLTLNPDGSFTYIANDDFNGTDSFTYTITDSDDDTDTATVTITVNPVADPPVATDDSYTIDEDTTLDITAPGVLANDKDPDGDLLTAILVDNPTNGTFSLNPDGSFTYEPNLNFFGTVSFTYLAKDGTADSDLATVTITVNSVVDPPIADAGPDQTVGEGRNVTLGGSNSFDTEGETLSYQWEQIGGPTVTLSYSQAANPTFTAPSPVVSGGESLTFRLTVTDEEAAQATDTAIVNVTLPLANRPPEADAGTDQNVEEGEPVTLKGSNSFDPDGDDVSYQWDQIAGPLITLSDPTAAKPTFDAPFVESDGLSYTFELTVTDTSGLQATDTSIVNVTLPSGNTPPEAAAGDDQTVDEDTDDIVTLNGSNSFDPEDENLFYRWRQVAGRPVTLSDPTAKQPTLPVPNVGLTAVTLIFELTVTDPGGLKAVVDTLVNVAGDDDLPVPDAGDDQIVAENNTVTLDGLASFDPEGQNLSYRWRQKAGYPVTLSDPSAVNPTFPAPNVTPIGIKLDFELTVTDVLEQQQRDDVVISVFGLNDQPIADAGDDQTVLEKNTVTLDASNSFDPDVDDIMTYQWNQTGGPAVTLSDPTTKLPTFEAPSFDDADGKPLIFELIVTDVEGEQSQEDSTTVTVSNFEKDNPGSSGGGCFIETAAYGFRWVK